MRSRLRRRAIRAVRSVRRRRSARRCSPEPRRSAPPRPAHLHFGTKPNGDHVAGEHAAILRDTVAAHVGAARAVEIVQRPSAEIRRAQLGVAHDVEVDVQIEVEIAARMPSDRHDRRLEPRPCTGAPTRPVRMRSSIVTAASTRARLLGVSGTDWCRGLAVPRRRRVVVAALLLPSGRRRSSPHSGTPSTSRCRGRREAAAWRSAFRGCVGSAPGCPDGIGDVRTIGCSPSASRAWAGASGASRSSAYRG